MVLIKKRPTTSSLRQVLVIKKTNIWKGKTIKNLTKIKKNRSGRNNLGKITVRGRCGGKKKKMRIINNNIKHGTYTVERIEYDPNRTSYIALIRKINEKKMCYIVAQEKLKLNSLISISDKEKQKIGNRMYLKNISIGTSISNIELKPNKGGQIARSAGNGALIVNKKRGKVFIKLNSGHIKIFKGTCKASIGIMSNIERKNIKLGKAGRKKWIGRKPKVRGVAKNPIDHPHGGGEGKTSGGRHPVTPWGKPTKGYKTRKNKKK